MIEREGGPTRRVGSRSGGQLRWWHRLERRAESLLEGGSTERQPHEGLGVLDIVLELTAEERRAAAVRSERGIRVIWRCGLQVEATASLLESERAFRVRAGAATARVVVWQRPVGALDLRVPQGGSQCRIGHGNSGWHGVGPVAR